MFNKAYKTQAVKSGLTGNKGYEVLSGVLGQMSDGLWENYKGYNKYWMNCEIRKSDNAIIVSKDYGSGFRDMTASEVREFFCCRIEKVVSEYIKDMKRNPPNSYYTLNNCRYLTYKEEISVAEIKQMVKKMRSLNESTPTKGPFGL